MRQLRVVSVCRTLPNPTDPSGGVFVLNRLAAMRQLMDVRVVQPVPYFPAVKPLPTWARDGLRSQGGLDISTPPMFYIPGVMKFLDPMWLARSAEKILVGMHKEQPIDLIDAHFGYPEGVGCVRVARKLGLPVFITIRGFEDEFVNRPLVGPQLISALQTAAGCVCVSYSLKELAIRHGVAPENVQVIHNAINWDVFNYGEAHAARQRLNFPLKTKLVVSVGHLVSRKRHHVLINAFARLRSQNPEAVLAIIGAKSFETAYPEQLTEQVTALGLEGSVKFLGNIPPAKVADWLRAADVFALGTVREGCCNAVLEALAAGVPVVTTGAGDNAYFVKAEENGYIVPVDDATAFANGLQRALAKSWPRSEISDRLRAQVGGWENVAARVLEFFNAKLGQRR